MLYVISLFIWIIFYFVPSAVAYYRDKSSKKIILALNIVLGWTLLAWVFLLVWAFSVDTESLGNYYYQSDQPRRSLLQKECPYCKSHIDYDYTSCPKCGKSFYRLNNNTSKNDSKNDDIDKNNDTYKKIIVEKWRCNQCDSYNEMGCVTCKNCGKYKYN